MKAIGVIGLGSMGQRRLASLARLPSVRLAGLCSRNETTLAEQAAQFDVERTTTDWRALLRDAALDAVCICTPNDSHAPIAEAALLAGKDVLVEYPMAVAFAELDRLIDTAEGTGRILHLGATIHFEAQQVAIKNRLGSLGEPVEFHGVMALPYVWKWSAIRT